MYKAHNNIIITYTGVAHCRFSCYEVTCCKLEVTSSNPTRIYLCPMSCGGCGAPRGIVVAGMDPWTPCHMSTILAPIVNSPSYKKSNPNDIMMMTMMTSLMMI